MSTIGLIIAVMRAVAQRRHPGVEIGRGARFGPGVRCTTEPGGLLQIGDGVEIGGHTHLSAFAGASLVIGDDVFVSGGCTIAAAREVRIGEGSMIAEFVSIRDHDHDPAYPPRSGRRLEEKVRVGARVWIGAKATIVRGGSIGDDAVIGAHAVVNRPIPPDVLAVGVPARIVRSAVRSGLGS